ncbi:hypothetical protein ACFQL4_00870 [Halosimplex aquaticum]
MGLRASESTRTQIALAAVVAVALLAGCTALESIGGHPQGDPASDRLGWESGYWYDDAVAVTPADGYNASEREAVVARTMARAERIRELEFNETVPVEVISRQQYLENRSSGGNGSATYERWNDQVWESLFVVGERSSYSNSSRRRSGRPSRGTTRPVRTPSSSSATPRRRPSTGPRSPTNSSTRSRISTSASAPRGDPGPATRQPRRHRGGRPLRRRALRQPLWLPVVVHPQAVERRRRWRVRR